MSLAYNADEAPRHDSTSESEKPYAATGDVEKGAVSGGNEVHVGGLDPDSSEGAVHRNLKARHLQMIAIGGAIGTGLFVGSGSALATGGPVGTLLGYSIMGTVVYSMMVSLGEMATLYPVSGAFVHYASRWVDPALGFALGYNYWYSYAITLPTEITAVGIVISYWDKTTNVAVWITIFFAVCVGFNVLGVKYYGEAEFWFSLMKVTTAVALIILGVILDLGGGPNHDRIGFRYWKNPGPFTQFKGVPGHWGQFLSFWSVFVQAAFSYLGTEIVALTAGEAENPRRNVPKAIRRVFYRILVFYVGGIIVIGWLVPSNNDQLLSGANNASASPFVIAIQNAGIKGLPSVVNAVIMVSAFSAGNSDLYASSRTLYGLALDNKTPRFMRYCTRRGIPIWCLAATAVVGFLAYMNVGGSAGKVFTYLSDLSSLTGLITWCVICFTYTRFYKGVKYHGIDRSSFPYRGPFQPYTAWWGFGWTFIIIWMNGFSVFMHGQWDTATFIVDYIPIPVFAILYIGWKLIKKPKWVTIEEMDFDTGRRALDEVLDAEEGKYTPPSTLAGKIWDWLM